MILYSIKALRDCLEHRDAVIDLIWTEWLDDHLEYGWKAKSDLDLVWDELYGENTIIALEQGTNELLGVCSITTDDLGIIRPNGLFIANLYTKPEYRKCGIGRALFQTAIEIAKSLTTNVYIWTYTNELVEWYKNEFGFVIDEVVGKYLAQECVVVMKLHGLS